MKKEFSKEDLENAFKAGEKLIENEWHNQEYHGTSCKCESLKYNNFEEWLDLNYIKLPKIKKNCKFS